MILTVVLPLIGLSVAAWTVPWLLAKGLPEGLGWLIVNGGLSAAMLATLSAVGFYFLYGPAGDAVLNADPWHFARLSVRAALIWGPVAVLSLANLPKGWKTAVW